MGRRGVAGPALVELTLAVFLIAVFALLFIMSKSGFIDALYCHTDTGQVQCKPRVDGCGDAGEYYFGFLHKCGSGYMCCKVPESERPPVTVTNPDQQGGTVIPEVQRLAPIEIKALDPVLKRDLTRGSIVTVFVNDPKTFPLRIALPPCKECDGWYVEEVHSRAGVQLNIPAANEPRVKFLAGASPTGLPSTVTTTYSGPEYVGDTITYTLVITPTDKVGGKEVNGTSQVYTLKYKVISPIQVVGLTSNWEQRKTVTVSCGNDIKCSSVYYTIQTDATACPATTAISTAVGKSLEQLPAKYCRVQDNKVTSQCSSTYNECIGILDQTPDDGALQTQYAIQAAIRNGVITQNYALFDQFAQQEPQVSSYSCHLDMSIDDSARFLTTKIEDPKVIPLNGTFDTTRQATVITLERNFMSDRYACFYGQDAISKKIYVAGAPQQIKIDTIPPVAEIIWRPSTLQLSFRCTDDKSGCKEYFWTAYVSDIGKFFPALMSRGGQNAALWCPAYKTTSGWRLQSKSDVLYNGNEVRVLCLRVEDNAGNAGVTKATIYNAYDAFAKILAAQLN